MKVQKNQNLVTKENIKRTKLIEAGSLPAGDIFELQATDATQKSNKLLVLKMRFLISKVALCQTLLLEDYATFDISR